METNEKETWQSGFLDRFRKSWFPPAAVAGAMAAFVAAAFRVRPAPKPSPRPTETPQAPERPEQAGQAARMERAYSKTAALGGATSVHPFRRSLAGIAVGAGDRIYALGDEEVRIFEAGGGFIQGWKAADKATCLTVGPEGRVYLGAPGRVEIYDAKGSRVGGFAAGEKDRPAGVTAIKLSRKEVLVADAEARLIRRYDPAGKQLGLIGTGNKTGSFMLPNGWLDIDVDAQGIVLATDTGRHRVTSWTLDGAPLGSFGKFGMRDPADFVGCCNPVNLAFTPDGKIVTAEKMVARVKVYEPDGRLIALIGPEHFDPNCVHIHLAVDSKGRILAADPVRREIGVFSLAAKEAEAYRPINDRTSREAERA
jgi:hypothetical protein